MDVGVVEDEDGGGGVDVGGKGRVVDGGKSGGELGE